MNASWQYLGTSFVCSVQTDSGACYLLDKLLPLPQEETASDVACSWIVTWEKVPPSSPSVMLGIWWWRNIYIHRFCSLRPTDPGPWKAWPRVFHPYLNSDLIQHMPVFNNQCLHVDIIFHSGGAQDTTCAGDSSYFWCEARKVLSSTSHRPPRMVKSRREASSLQCSTQPWSLASM